MVVLLGSPATIIIIFYSLNILLYLYIVQSPPGGQERECRKENQILLNNIINKYIYIYIHIIYIYSG